MTNDATKRQSGNWAAAYEAEYGQMMPKSPEEGEDRVEAGLDEERDGVLEKKTDGGVSPFS